MASSDGYETQDLTGSGLVKLLAERWEAAKQGDKSALMASGEELPPLKISPRGAFGRGAGGMKVPGITQPLLQTIMQEADADELVEHLSVEERRPGGGLVGDGEGDDASDDPRRTSLVQFVHARLKNKGSARLVIKSPKPSPEVSKVLDVTAMARKEAGMYKHVLPNMAGLWKNQSFAVFPKCYHASPDIIVLEDLQAQGFAASHAAVVGGLSEAQCAAALGALARFHAASLVYKVVGVAEAGAVLAEAGHETVYSAARRPALEKLLQAATGNTLELLKRHPTASKHARAVKALLSDRFDRLLELHRPREPMAVLTHGDPRASNILFRNSLGVAERAPEELEARLVDLRACRYGSPALDIIRLLWGGGAAADARAAQDVLLRGYYMALSKAMKDAPGARAPPFSLADLRKEVERYAVYGLLTADVSLRLQLNAAGREMVAEQSDEERSVDDFFASNAPGDAFARAFGDLVLELADKGLLH